MIGINTKEYWNHRFSTDWIANFGKQQSAFFYEMAVDFLPEWLISLLEKNNYSICDWGCALGDGTNILKKRFQNNRITGIDFSAVAIEAAREQYPNIEFSCQDLLEKPSNKNYNIFFTSNTLEHFKNPWQTLTTLSAYASNHLVVLVPFKEINRCNEHQYTFTELNIHSSLANSFFLTHIEIINGNNYNPTYWDQQQVLLIYSHEKEIKDEVLRTISPVEIIMLEKLHQHKNAIQDINQIKSELTTQLNQGYSEFNALLSKQIGTLAEKANILNIEKELQKIVDLLSNQVLLQQIQTEHDELKRVVAEKDNQINALIANIASVNELNSYLSNLVELGRHEQASFVLQKEKELNEIKLMHSKEINSVLDEKQNIVTDLNNEIVTLKNKLVRNEERIQEAEKLCDEKDQVISKLHFDLNNIKAQVDQIGFLEAEIQNYKEKTSFLIHDTENTKNTLAQTQSSMNELQQYISRLQADIKWYQSTFENRSLLGLMKYKITKKFYK